MKKIFFFVSVLFLLLFSSSIFPTPTKAALGDCCNGPQDCGQNEACSGTSAECSFAGSLGFCESTNGSCQEDGELCDQDASSDTCCNGCKNSGDYAPFNYTCGGKRNPLYNTSPTNKPRQPGPAQTLDLNAIQENAFGDKFKFHTIGDLFDQENLRIVFAIAGILLLVYFSLGGLQLMFAAGDPKRVEAARAKITNAVVGFVIVFLSFWIVQLVGVLLNIHDIKDIFKAPLSTTRQSQGKH